MSKAKVAESGKVLHPGRFDFIGSSKYLFTFSCLLIVGAFILIATRGFHYGVDFAGGTEVQVRFEQQLGPDKVRGFMSDLGLGNASIQAFEGNKEFLIRLDPVNSASEKEANETLKEIVKKITDGLTGTFKSEGASVLRVDTVGPQVGSELKRNGILAACYSILLILIYIGLRFDYKYAPGAVFCLIHDSLFILGMYSLFHLEMNVQIMAAILTIIGYSMNDTIVVFDRIRENEKLFRGQSFQWICNRSMNDCLSRTILTSCTTFMSVMVMWALAGGVIRDFAMTMAIGIVVGTYSTIYVATPLIIWIDKLEHAKQRA